MANYKPKTIEIECDVLYKGSIAMICIDSHLSWKFSSFTCAHCQILYQNEASWMVKQYYSRREMQDRTKFAQNWRSKRFQKDKLYKSWAKCHLDMLQHCTKGHSLAALRIASSVTTGTIAIGRCKFRSRLKSMGLLTLTKNIFWLYLQNKGNAFYFYFSIRKGTVALWPS